MKIPYHFTLLLAGSLCAVAQASSVQQAPDQGALVARQAALPSPVKALLARSDECLHWSGEDAYDAERGAQIEKAVTRLRCDTVAADAARLEQRYRKNPAAVKALREVQAQ